jgi:hypothetical protein
MCSELAMCFYHQCLAVHERTSIFLRPGRISSTQGLRTLKASKAGSVVMLVMAGWIVGVWREYPELKGLSLRTERKACQALCVATCLAK